MNNVKKNNKGFSLVELIVVVLIMAIIAVSLAPQVMKWVNNSRIATDIQTGDSVVSAAQLALTNKDAYAAVTGVADGKAYTITLAVPVSGTTNGYTIACTDTSKTVNASNAFVKAFCEAAGITADDAADTLQLKTTGASIVVTIAKDGKVTKTTTGLSSTDLN